MLNPESACVCDALWNVKKDDEATVIIGMLHGALMNIVVGNNKGRHQLDELL